MNLFFEHLSGENRSLLIYRRKINEDVYCYIIMSILQIKLEQILFYRRSVIFNESHLQLLFLFFFDSFKVQHSLQDSHQRISQYLSCASQQVHFRELLGAILKCDMINYLTPMQQSCTQSSKIILNSVTVLKQLAFVNP